MTILGKQQSASNKLYWVADNIIADDFPDVSSALRDPDGLLAIGGDLEPERLLDAYRRGIFPWYSQGQPVLWWSPDPRCVLIPDELKISRSLAKTLRWKSYQVTYNQAFTEVIEKCSGPRRGNPDTWITNEIIRAYSTLHTLGHALSVECWHNRELVGGLYGVVIDRVFFGESMFSTMADASKVALVHLVRQLQSRGFQLIDCQITSKHLQSLGAKALPRDEFIKLLSEYCIDNRPHNWSVADMPT
jgi:leucyl/phenylalanyl-tRNA--protein transferase